MKDECVNDNEESEICFSCMKPNLPGGHFCEHCGTPLTTYSTTAPYEHVLALGDCMRKAIQSNRWSWPVRVACCLIAVLLVVLVSSGMMIP